MASHLGALLHLAAGKHAVCAEHGELVHVDSHAAGPEHGSDHDPLGDHALTDDPAGPVESDEHDHCSIAVTRAEAAFCPHVFVLRAPRPPVVVSQPAAPVECIRTPGIATYLIAPKQSPPA